MKKILGIFLVALMFSGCSKYTWNEIPGGLYEINSDELADAREIPFGNIRLNS